MNDYCATQLINPNPQLFDDALWDVAKGHCSFFRTSLSNQLIVSLSLIDLTASCLVIYIILISSTRLSSIYHRIMFGISTSEATFSIAGALGTLPMPAPGDMWTDINNFQGPRIGNIHTCAAQGFTYDLGYWGWFSGFFILFGYYISSIVFEIPEETIQKFEPRMYLFFTCITLWLTLNPLFNDDYNVTYNFPICASTAKPWFCQEANNVGVDCVRGKSAKNLDQNTQLILSYNITATMLMFAILVSVYISDKIRSKTLNQLEEDETKHCLLKRRGDIRAAKDVSRDDHKYDRFEKTKRILYQALWYTPLSVNTLCWSLCLYVNQNQDRPNLVLMSTLTILGSTEGLSILLVFVFHKVHNLKVSNPSISIKEALWDVFMNGGAHDAIVIMEMDRVKTSYHSISHAAPNYDHEVSVEQDSSVKQSPSIYFSGFFQSSKDQGSERSAGVSAISGSTRSQISTGIVSLEALSYQQQQIPDDCRSGAKESGLYSIAEQQISSRAPLGSSWDGLSLSYHHSSIDVDRSAFGDSGLFSIAESTRLSQRKEAK